MTTGTEIEPVDVVDDATMLVLVAGGDCSRLTPAQKLSYYHARCSAAGLDPRTQPFQFVRMQNKEILYCLKGGTDQLSAKHGIVVEIITQGTEAGIRTVTVRGRTRDLRQTDEIGCVSVAGLAGDALCNAYMKAVTKAKRRCVLSLCGLGMMDETELETVASARTATAPVSLQSTQEESPFEFAYREAKRLAEQLPEDRRGRALDYVEGAYARKAEGDLKTAILVSRKALINNARGKQATQPPPPAEAVPVADVVPAAVQPEADEYAAWLLPTPEEVAEREAVQAEAVVTVQEDSKHSDSSAPQAPALQCVSRAALLTILATAKRLKLPEGKFKAWICAKYGVDSRKQLTQDQASAILSLLNSPEAEELRKDLA